MSASRVDRTIPIPVEYEIFGNKTGIFTVSIDSKKLVRYLVRAARNKKRSAVHGALRVEFTELAPDQVKRAESSLLRVVEFPETL